MKVPQLLKYEVAPNVYTFSSTRHGGCSKGNYGEFNVNAYCGDKAENIESNRIALCKELGIEQDCLIMPHQVHGTEVLNVNEDFLRRGQSERKEILEGKDALITQMRNVCIAISTADCVPVILYASEHKIAAAIHAGWRGTLQRIVEKTTDVLISNFSVTAAEIKAVIGPSISLKAFEVGNEVYEAFEKESFPMDEIATKINGKWHIDLWKANKLQLNKLNINDDNISISGICTYDNADNFFSARRLGIDSGRVLSGIILR